MAVYELQKKINEKGDTEDVIIFGVATYIHTQSSAAKEWVITHSLNKFPSVTVVDSAGDVVCGDITYINANSVKITFSAGFSGKAYLN